jgi:hypothetical protein
MKKIFFIALIAAFILAACGVAARNAEAPADYASGVSAPQESYAEAPNAPSPITSEGAAKSSAFKPQRWNAWSFRTLT